MRYNQTKEIKEESAPAHFKAGGDKKDIQMTKEEKLKDILEQMEELKADLAAVAE